MKLSCKWLKDYVAWTGSVKSVSDELTMAGLEVQETYEVASSKDQCLDIEITSNRPDWLSHVGVAREIATLQGANLSLPPYANKVKLGEKGPKVASVDKELCPYYTTCLLEDVEFGAAPDFIRERLDAVGVRSINLIVDVTNYVLLEWGQPLHAFDSDRLVGDVITARAAKKGEKFVAINESEYELSAQDLVIADGEKAIALAGVMGGLNSEVTSRTRNILLESAYFKSSCVRRMSQRFNLVSDSSYRFERGVDPEGVDIARERAIHLILKYAKKVGKVHRVVKAGKAPVKPRTIRFPLSDIERTLGIKIPQAKVRTYLNSLGLKAVKANGEIFNVKVPSFRADVQQPIDLIEEIARIHGYDKLPDSMPVLEPAYVEEPRIQAVENKARELVIGAGYYETITFSLISEAIFEKLKIDTARFTRIVNPQNKELVLMRPTLLPSLMDVVKTNNYHGNGPDLRFFEVASIYGEEKKGKLCEEFTTLGLALSGAQVPHWQDKGRGHSIYDIKGLLEKLLSLAGVSAWSFEPVEDAFLSEGLELVVKGQTIGRLGKAVSAVKDYYDVKDDVFLAEVNLTQLAKCYSDDRQYTAPSKYPPSLRDIAIILDEHVRAEEVLGIIRSIHGDWIRHADVMDLFTGKQIPKGKKSLAFSITYQAPDRTLSNEMVTELHDKVIAAVLEKFKAELRA